MTTPSHPSGYQNQLVAEFYDHAAPLQGRDDVPFFVESAQAAGGAVLELGCGTGRILIPTARAGISITGIDSSAEMLDTCRKKLQQEAVDTQSRVELLQADIRDIDLDRKFNLITVPFRAFHHLITVEDQVACLDCARNHLAPGGRLILDLINPILIRIFDEKGVPAITSEPPVTMPDGRTIQRTQRNASVNLNEQAISVEHTYNVTHTGGNTETSTVEFPMRYFFRYEIEHLLARCGFAMEAVYCDYEKTPYGAKFPGEMVFVSSLIS